MKRFYKQFFIVFVCVLTNGLIKAQNVIIDGEIRPRTEIQDGFSTPTLSTFDPGVFTIQRTRLGMTFTSGLLTSQITIQDSRTFGQYSNTASDASTGVFEAWANMLLFPGGALTIGRQAIKYDDNRLFSASAWSNTGTTHDLAVFKYGINDFQFNLGLAYNNNKDTTVEKFYSPVNKYRSLGYIWVSTPVYKGFSLSGIFVAEGLQDTTGFKVAGKTIKDYKLIDLNQTLTFGGNLKYENTEFPLSGLATAYFQAGINEAGKTMNGKLIALKANYAVNKLFSLSLGTDYISGDTNGTSDGKVSNFKKLYGANHAFNGYMEYWKSPLTQGLIDYYGSVNAKIGTKLSLEGVYHYFNSEFAGKNKKNIEFGKQLGSELDITAIYKLNSWSTIQAGYSRYFTNNNTLIAKNIVTTAGTFPSINSAQWAYVMFTIKPSFLNTATATK